MFEWIIDEWRQRGIGVLIVGGQALIERGLRDYTKDLDSCVSARQCPRVLEWLFEKEREGHVVKLRLGSAPLHADWLGMGWTCHVFLDREKLDFFGVPMRAPPLIAERFWADPIDIVVASLGDMGYLKRTGRLKDWGDIDLIAGRLRRDGDIDGMLQHLFGGALVKEMEWIRDQPSFRESIGHSDQARIRPILRMGLTAPNDELNAMAQTELSFWITAGALRAQEITRIAKDFWKKYADTITGAVNFAAAHARLQTAAAAELSINPIRDPAAIIEAARKASGVDRWPGLMLPTPELVFMYFPAYRSALSVRLELDAEKNPKTPSHEPEP